MRVRKKSGGGGLYETSPRTERRIARERRKKEREARKSPRQNLAPQNPRFLPSSQMTGVRPPVEEKKEEKKKKPKTVTGRRGGNRSTTRSSGRASFGRNRGRGARTSSSCRSGNCP